MYCSYYNWLGRVLHLMGMKIYKLLHQTGQFERTIRNYWEQGLTSGRLWHICTCPKINKYLRKCLVSPYILFVLHHLGDVQQPFVNYFGSSSWCHFSLDYHFTKQPLCRPQASRKMGTLRKYLIQGYVALYPEWCSARLLLWWIGALGQNLLAGLGLEKSLEPFAMWCPYLRMILRVRHRQQRARYVHGVCHSIFDEAYKRQMLTRKQKLSTDAHLLFTD